MTPVKYLFRAKDIKTGNMVVGSLVYVNMMKGKTIPMIVTIGGNGGMLYVEERYRIDESTIELIKE